MDGAVVARMPRPVVQPGTVLIRVRYSFVSVGTEIAPLRPARMAAPDASAVDINIERARLARHYLRASLRDPRKAARRLSQIAERRIARLLPERSPALPAAAPGEASAAPRSSDLGAQGWAVGYSAAGEVVAVGSGITDLVPGDRVAAAGANVANHADFIVVPRNLVARVPDGCDLKDAASATIGAIAMQGVRRAAPQLGEIVAVLGLGLIGQLTVQLLRAAGCRVLGLDLDPSRLERARSLGIEAGASDADTFKAVVRDVTAGFGADRTLMTAATRSDAVINLAMEVTRAKGTVVIVGDVGLDVDRAVFYRKEIDLLMSTSYGPGRYDATYEAEGRDYPYAYVRWTLNRNLQAYLTLIGSGAVRVTPLIDRVVPIDEAPAVYRELAKGEGTLPMGVVIEYPDASDADVMRLTLGGHRTPPKDRVAYALVGAGSFGTSMLVPQMQKRKDRFALRGIVSRTGTHGSNFAREHQVEVLATDLDTILADPAFDLVVIATRHADHADQVVRSLRAGKHVFVEKPLAISWQELSTIAETYAAVAARPLLMVGFNRRFSPALQAIKERIASRRAPIMIEYRLNAGYIPLDHWVHGPQGGGRNVGEACHMYDVFRFLTASAVESISATAIDPRGLAYSRNDNFSATIGYADGSVASLLYTALGPKSGMGKEHITVFCDGDAYIVDDFRRAVRASDGSVLWQSGEADKGHFEELSRMGDAIASGGEAPIAFDELIETSAVALHVEDLLFQRQPAPAPSVG